MGDYIYHLTTKSRRLRTPDGPQDVFLCAFAGKEQRSGYGTSRSDTLAENLIHARREKLWQAWYKRTGYSKGDGYPQFVVMGKFQPGASVYTDWPTEGATPMLEVIETPNEAKFVGFLRADGQRLRLERWEEMIVEFDTLEAADTARTQMRSFVGEREYLSRIEAKPSPRVVIAYHGVEVGALIKMALP